MKQLTTTKAMYKGIPITVLSDRFEGRLMYCCTNGLGGPGAEEKWYPTQGEAIANERHEIDRMIGPVRQD